MLSADSKHEFAHISSHCDAQSAHVMIIYDTVSLVLYADASRLHPQDAYSAHVETMKNAGQIPKETLLAAHKSLVQIVTESFQPTILDLFSKYHALLGHSVADMLTCPQYTLRLDKDKNKVAIEGPVQANPYCIHAIPLTTIPSSDTITVFPAQTLLFEFHAPDSGSLAGLVRLPHGGGTAWFKPAEESKTEGFLTDLAAYRRVTSACRQSASSTRPRIPVLRALATTRDGGEVIGILITPIRGKVLRDVGPAAKARHGKRWRRQVEESVRFLHANGVVWGDVNATNVLVDDQDDAWILDFEGGRAGLEGEVLVAEMLKRDSEGTEVLFTNDLY